MSDMKCPVCNSYLHKIPVKEAWVCSIHDSKDDLYGSKALWQELIRTRKALDKAKWWLNEIVENHRCTPISTAEMALKQITALEQKDVK